MCRRWNLFYEVCDYYPGRTNCSGCNFSPYVQKVNFSVKVEHNYQEKPFPWPPQCKTREEYKTQSMNCGIKEGDRVKIVRSIDQDKINPYGWVNVWCREMNDAVGKTATVEDKNDISHTTGFNLKPEGMYDYYRYPFYVLKVIKGD